MAIKIDFLSNVRQFLRGTDDAEDALDDVADSLDDMADAAKKGGRDAERSVEKLDDSFRDAARRAKDLGKSGKDAGRDVKHGMKNAEDGVEEFKDEANSTAREAAASFDGSAESIADVFQEVAANAFTGFGPAGAIAGLAAAAGIGLAVSGFTATNEASEESRNRVADWAQAYIDAGGDASEALASVARVSAIYTDPDLYTKAQDNARNWGVSVSTAVNAMAGDMTALGVVSESTKRRQDEWAEALQDGVTGSASSWDKSNLTDKQRELGQQVAAGRDALEQLNGEMAAGASIAYQQSRSLFDLAKNTGTATGEVDELGNKIIALPDGTEVVINAQTKTASEDVDAFERKVGNVKGKTVKVKVDTSDAARSIARFINQGRQIKIGTRIVGPASGGWN